MSYNPKINTGVTPFAQLSNSVNFNMRFVRYNQVSVSWASEFNSGNNGYQFTGNGFIWGHMSETNSGTSDLASFRIGPSSVPQSQWGYWHNNSPSARVSMDDEFFRYGDSTEVTVQSSSTGNLDPAVHSSSRTNIIRMEL